MPLDFEDWLDEAAARDASLSIARLGGVDVGDVSRYFVSTSVKARGGRVVAHRILDRICDRGRSPVELHVAAATAPDGDRLCRIAIVVHHADGSASWVTLHHRVIRQLIKGLERARDAADELRRVE